MMINDGRKIVEVAMQSEHTEGFIEGLCEKTQNGQIRWEPLRMCKKWVQFEAELGDMDERMEAYGASLDNSYFLEKEGGYVFLLEVHYGNKNLFSPALDKYVLAVKINDMIPFQYLCDSDNEAWKPLLEELYGYVCREDAYTMPDALYDFMDKVLGN